MKSGFDGILGRKTVNHWGITKGEFRLVVCLLVPGLLGEKEKFMPSAVWTPRFYSVPDL
jgi:hypothetical protein